MASKNTTRRPVETDPWDLTEAIAATDARLERAITAAHQADIELAEAATRIVALQARQQFPSAWAVVLEWSDQGDHLSVSGLAGVAGERLTVDVEAWNAFLDDGADNCASNLAGHTEYIWLPYMRPLDRARNSTDPYHLDILNTVSITEATR